MTELNRDEDWFWNSEPRVVVSLIQAKKDITKENMKALAVYVGCIFSGKSFDEIEDYEDDELEGIDKPVSEANLRRLY